MFTIRLARAGLVAAAVVATTVALNVPVTGAIARPRLVVFESPTGLSEVVDVGSSGFGTGDSIVENHPLLDPQTGAHTGTAVTHITIVETLPGDNILGIVDCTIRLADGTIVFYGAVETTGLADGVTLAVTGGTGSYAKTRGTVTISADRLGDLDGYRIAFDIT